MAKQSIFTESQINECGVMQFSTHLFNKGRKTSGFILSMTETTVTLSLLNGRSKKKFDISDLDINYIV
jgi:hypothetical protein